MRLCFLNKAFISPFFYIYRNILKNRILILRLFSRAKKGIQSLFPVSCRKQAQSSSEKNGIRKYDFSTKFDTHPRTGGASPNKNDPKILVLIIAADNERVYEYFQKIWKAYMDLDPNHFECYWIRATPHLTSQYLIEGNTIWSKGEESLVPGVLNKTLFSIEALLSRLDDFDYLLRANLSSFFVFPRLLNFLKTTSRKNFYCGIHDKDPSFSPKGWVCGAGMILSIDLVKMLHQHQQEFLNLDPACYPKTVDDVVIGNFFALKGIPIVPGLYRTIFSSSDWTQLKNHLPDDVFHFRIKTEARSNPGPYILDTYIHVFLLKHFYGISLQSRIYWILEKSHISTLKFYWRAKRKIQSYLPVSNKAI